MAEMLGAVASGISIAQFAGSIIKTGFRIKTLLDDVRDVPEDLQRHLGQIQVLASLLAEVDHGLSISNGALLAAAEQCRQAALELDVLATELSNQVQSSQGFNRRFRSLQAVLQKSTLARHEKRMQASMQMLMLALQLTSLCRQNELIQLQQSQPGLIAAEVIGSLQVARRADQPRGNAHGTGTGIYRTRERFQTGPSADVKAIHRLGLFQPTTTIGIDWLTGSLEYQNPSHATVAETKTGGDEETISYRVKVRFPRWLSERALDSLLYKNSLGWNHILVPYSVRSMRSDVGSQLSHIMHTDDVQGLKVSLQGGAIALRDHFIQEFDYWINETGKRSNKRRYDEECLFSLAMGARAWKIGNYLEEMGVSRASEEYSVASAAWNNDDARAYHLRSFLLKLDDTFPIIVSLACFIGTIEEFRILRREFWPDSQFFHESFTDIRVEVAASIGSSCAGNYAHHTLQSEKIRQILLQQEGLSYEFGSYPETCTLLRCVEMIIGRATFNGDDLICSIWAELWLELANAGFAYKDNFLLQDRPVQFEKPSRRLPACGWVTNLLEGVRRGFLGPNRNHATRQRRFTCLVFDRAMNEALGVYLGMLRTCGVDLASLHRGKLPMLREYRNGERGRPFVDTPCLTLYCTGLTHGPNPEDWRFFCADDTESYAGDFWELVDPAPLWIPGSWVDDDMD
ncbi:hypothetical protein PG991_003034 [Apiospora marii]|uniref:Fungal N-terminal domain-containing protein n=1 Tax=Apiospora marii TaxID=335849 RepID=A0ABR1SIB5_9PEZI